MNTKKWTCKDGTKIRIKDMSDSHLINTVKFLERQSHILQNIASSCFRGDIQQCPADQEYEALTSSGVSDCFPIYDDMTQEMGRRKLQVEGMK